MATRGKNKANIEAVGGKKLTPATQMMGHGYDPFLSEGANDRGPPMALSIRASTAPIRRSSKIGSRCGTAPTMRSSFRAGCRRSRR
jgi:hypothetical protein